MLIIQLTVIATATAQVKNKMYLKVFMGEVNMYSWTNSNSLFVCIMVVAKNTYAYFAWRHINMAPTALTIFLLYLFGKEKKVYSYTIGCHKTSSQAKPSQVKKYMV